MDHLQSTLKISFAQYSDKGPKPENQDTLGARIPEGSVLTSKGIALALADGVSSSQSAKQASQAAVTGFLTDYYATPDTWRTQQSAIRVIQSLNRFLWGQSQNSVLGEGHLTTFSSLIFKGNQCFVFHVGDTRVYRYRANVLEQLTRDHTQKIDQHSTYLSRALGGDPVLEIDMLSEEIHPGDIYLLTSDGVHAHLPFHHLLSIINQHKDPQTICDTAITQALAMGCDDNLSIQVARIDATGNPSQQDAVAVLSQLPFPPPLDIGNSIDSYRVQKILHESERSQVYIVSDAENHSYIMKTPSPNYEGDQAYTERFVMEAWIGTRIQNSNVVKVIPPQGERRFLYYLTEHIKGPSLAKIIEQRAPAPIPDAIELIEGIVKGVRAFHRKDTLHQDLKPDNIIVGAQGPVIIDFGSCFVAGIHEAGAPFERDSILGTLSYSAPEYRYGGKVSHLSDQFSLAVMLYELLTGHFPYGEPYEKAMTLKALQRLRYTPARKHNPLVPMWLDRSLEKSLDIMPQRRYDSLSEWLCDLKRPNPRWLTPQELPLLERNPLKFWQLASLVGWASALVLLVDKLNG